MALINCKECGSQISDKAKTCPQCGAAQPKKTSRLTWMVAIFFALFAIMSIFFGSKDNARQTGPQNSAEQKLNHIPPKVENWVTSTSNDEMRGTKLTSTSTVSKNTVNFAFPYDGGSKLALTVRNKNNEKDVIIFISKGQFICGSFDGCEVNFKFDDGPIQSILMVGSDSHDSDTLFINNPKTIKSIIQKIKESKQLIIEPKFYQEGSKQFSFDLDGFIEP